MARFYKILVIVLFPISLRHAESFKIIFEDNISPMTPCDANRIYKQDDVTCICSSDGRWPHENCSQIFGPDKLMKLCEPDSYVIIGCNVCRCNKEGRIDKELCTNHDCKDDQERRVSRRSNSKNKCQPTHWYTLPNCAICYCINKNNLMCSNGNTTPNTLQILGKYNLTDCGTDFVQEAKTLMPVGNALRKGHKKEKSQESESVENQMQSVEVEKTPTIVTENELLSHHNLLNIKHRDNGGDENSSVERDDVSVENAAEKNSNENSFELDDVLKGAKSKPIGRIAANTVIPFDNEEEDNNNNDSNNSVSDNKDETDKDVSDGKKETEELNTSVYKPVHKPVNKQVVHFKIDSEPKQDHDDGEDDIQKLEAPKQSDKNNILRLNFPMLLGKVFSLGLRRSLLSLDDSKCEPGSTVEVKCNTCYCMKNGKMLCTKNICE